MRDREASLLEQQQEIDHFHCHLRVLVQHHGEHPLLKHTHTHAVRPGKIMAADFNA